MNKLDVSFLFCRVGRTGRAENRGMALSFFPQDSTPLLTQLKEHLSLSSSSKTSFVQFQDFNPQHVAGLKYRANDVIRC